MLARAIAPVVGYDQAAVCVLDGESTIVVMVDDDGDEPQTAIKQLSGGPDHLVHWLTTLFDRSSWQPNGIVIVGADHELGVLAARLEAAVPVPVIAQPGADLALARGAALASAQSTEFTDAEMLETVNSWRQDHEASQQRSYAGALTMLGAGAVTFVASLSLALGQHLVPHHAPDPVRPVAHCGRARTCRRGPGSATGRGPNPGRPPGLQACAGASAGRPAAARGRSGAGQRARSRAGSAARGATSGGTSAAGRAAQPAPAADEVARTAARAGARPAAAATTSAARSAVAVASAGRRSVNP